MSKLCETCNKYIVESSRQASRVSKKLWCDCLHNKDNKYFGGASSPQSSTEDPPVEADEIETSSKSSSKYSSNANVKNNKKNSNPPILLSTINPDLWFGLQVRVQKAAITNIGDIGSVLRSGNGWVNLRTKNGMIAKRAYHLELVNPPPVETSKVPTPPSGTASSSSSVNVSSSASGSTKRKISEENVETDVQDDCTIDVNEIQPSQEVIVKGRNKDNKSTTAAQVAVPPTGRTNDRKRNTNLQIQASASMDEKSQHDSKNTDISPSPQISVPSSPTKKGVRSSKRKIGELSDSATNSNQTISGTSSIADNGSDDNKDSANESFVSVDQNEGISISASQDDGQEVGHVNASFHSSSGRRIRSRSFSDSIVPDNIPSVLPVSAHAAAKVTSSGRTSKPSIALTPMNETSRKLPPRKPPTYNSSANHNQSHKTSSLHPVNPKSSSSSLTAVTIGSSGIASATITDADEPITSSSSSGGGSGGGVGGGFSAFASNGPKLNALLCEVKRSMVAKYVERHQEKIKNRPNLLQWSLKINSKFIDVEYEKSIARRVVLDSHCTSCFCELLIGSSACYNELCLASPIYWAKDGAAGHLPTALPITQRSYGSFEVCTTTTLLDDSSPVLGSSSPRTYERVLSRSNSMSSSNGRLNSTRSSGTTTDAISTENSPRLTATTSASELSVTGEQQSSVQESSSNKSTHSTISVPLLTIDNTNTNTNTSVIMSPRTRKNKSKGFKSPLDGKSGSFNGFVSPRRRNSFSFDKDGNVITNGANGAVSKASECGPFPTGGTSFSMTQLLHLPDSIDLSKEVYSSLNNNSNKMSSMNEPVINNFLLYAGRRLIELPAAVAVATVVTVADNLVVSNDKSSSSVNVDDNALNPDAVGDIATAAAADVDIVVVASSDSHEVQDAGTIESKLFDKHTVECEAGVTATSQTTGQECEAVMAVCPSDTEGEPLSAADESVPGVNMTVVESSPLCA